MAAFVPGHVGNLVPGQSGAWGWNAYPGAYVNARDAGMSWTTISNAGDPYHPQCVSVSGAPTQSVGTDGGAWALIIISRIGTSGGLNAAGLIDMEGNGQTGWGWNFSASRFIYYSYGGVRGTSSFGMPSGLAVVGFVHRPSASECTFALNGAVDTPTTVSGYDWSGKALAGIGGGNGYASHNADILGVVVGKGLVTDDELSRLTADPWALLVERQPRIFVPLAAAPGSHNTTAENASAASTLDTGGVTQTHALAAANASSAATLTTSEASSAAYTTAETAASATTLDTGAVVQTHVASAADATSAGSTTGASVSQTHQLVAADTSSASSLTTSAAGSESYTTPQTAASASSMTSPVVTQDHVLSAADAISAGLLTAAEVSQAHVVTAADLSSESSLGASAASSGSFTTPQTAHSAGSLSAPTTAQTHLTAGADATSGTGLTEPAAAHVQSLTPADMVSASSLTAGTIPTGDWYYHPMWFRETVERAARFRQ